MNTSVYPVRVQAHLDPTLSRWLWLFKWLLAIPHFVVLAFLWVAFVVLSVVAFFAILFTGRYPRDIFDFNVGVLRWSWRVTYYSCGALATDRYPPFSLKEDPDYPAHLEVEYPERLSRGLVLVKSWLLAIPHYLVVGLFVSGAWYTVDSSDWNGSDGATGGLGLIGLLVLVAVVVLLFTGRYPQPIYDFVLGMNRWVLRVACYSALMTDEYPPFRLDQGGDDPALLGATAVGEPAPPASGAATSGSAEPTSGWGGGRIVSVVIGSLLLLGSICAGLAGGAMSFADTVLRDDAGFLMSGEQTFTTDTYALTSTSLDVAGDAPGARVPHALLGDATVTATPNSDAPVFVGVAATSDVRAFLGDTRHATVVNWRARPTYRVSGTAAPSSLPDASTIWVAQSEGPGTQQVTWPVEQGDWTVVVMNADGARGVTADVAVGATVPVLDWLAPTLLVTAGVGLLLGVVMLVVALVPRR